MKDVAAREAKPARSRCRELRIAPLEAIHVHRRVARPALPADVVVEAAVAVGEDVEPGELLVADVDGERVLILLAEPDVDHRVEERASAEILRVPGRSRERPDDRGREHG